jgi:hypothetical protein
MLTPDIHSLFRRLHTERTNEDTGGGACNISSVNPIRKMGGLYPSTTPHLSAAIALQSSSTPCSPWSSDGSVIITTIEISEGNMRVTLEADGPVEKHHYQTNRPRLEYDDFLQYMRRDRQLDCD